MGPRSEESRRGAPASTVEATDASDGPAPPTKALAAMALHDGGLPPGPPAAAPAVQGDDRGGEQAEAQEPAAPGSAATVEGGLEEDGEEQEVVVGFDEGHGFPEPGQLIATVSDPTDGGPQQLVRLVAVGDAR